MKMITDNLSNINDSIQGSFDAFLCCVSFESRCLSIAMNIDPAKIKKAIIFENKMHKDLHGSNPKALSDRFGSTAELLYISTNDPLQTADSIYGVLSQLLKDEMCKILIDITTFTHEALLILFRTIVHLKKFAQVQMAYSTASEYSVGDPYDKKWLSRGIVDVRSVLGYPGLLIPSQKLHLIVLAGFERDRIEELVSSYEPSIISLGYGSKHSDTSNGHAKTGSYVLESLKQIYGDAKAFNFPSYEPFHARDEILRQVEKYPDHNVVIAPLNTKLSTIGAALASLKDEHIQLCYSQAVIYNYRNYSIPGDRYFLFDCPKPY